MLNGYYRYYAVPTNSKALSAFYIGTSGIDRCNVAVKRDRGRPRGSLSIDLKWEPGAGDPLAGFCLGDGPKGPSLPELRVLSARSGNDEERRRGLHELVRGSFDFKLVMSYFIDEDLEGASDLERVA